MQFRRKVLIANRLTSKNRSTVLSNGQKPLEGGYPYPFVGSEVEEKRQLIKLILQNFSIDAENIVWELHKPFDLLLKCSEDIEWRAQMNKYILLSVVVSH